MKVVDHEQLPGKLPLTDTIVMWFVLDRSRAPGWVWGAVGLFVVAAWFGCIVKICRQRLTKLKELT